MNKQQIRELEVRPETSGWYLVTLFQYEKLEPEHPDYFKDWLDYDGTSWDYGHYSGVAYVCFINERDEDD